MAQAIDTLEVIFSADMGPLNASLTRINGQLTSLTGAAGVADASLRNMANALDFGMESLKRQANSAGAAVGDAFAKGLRSKKGAVDSAVKYLTDNALQRLKKLLDLMNRLSPSSLDPSSLGPRDLPENVNRRSGLTSPASYAPKDPGQANAPAAEKVIDLTVPISVDGIKLGEACIRGIRAAAGLTGRAVINM